MCCKLLTSKWDWCVSHLCNCALVEAFGTNLQLHKCKNLEFRLLKKVKSVIEHLHKSAPMRGKFEDLQFEEVGTRQRLIQDMPHRWLGIMRVLERFLSLWGVLRKHYLHSEERTFPVDDDHQVLIECFSHMKPVGNLIVLSQSASYPAIIDSFLALCRLRKMVFCEASPLPIYDPTADNYSPDKPSTEKHPIMLHDVTTKTRDLLSEAFDKRFFNGYNGTPRSDTLETQVFFHPSFRTLRCFDSIMSVNEAANLLIQVNHSVFEMAKQVAEASEAAAGVNLRQEGEEPPRKTMKGSDATPTANEEMACEPFLSFREFEDPYGSELYQQQSLDDRFQEELTKYIEEERVPAAELPTRRLLSWWKAKTSRYPNLSVVAKSVLSHPASSAQIERDFGSAGALLSGSRSRLDTSFVDMSLFLNANFTSIPSRVAELQ